MEFKKNPKTDFKPISELDKDQAAQEIEALREGIEYHDYRYYVKDAPVISDAVYDKLFERLQALEEAFPDLRSEHSPTQRVGATPVSELRKVRHTAPMLSLQAALDEDAVQSFHTLVQRETGQSTITYDLEPKFDGFSVEVVYRDLRFDYGATRGNGDIGEDISHNLRAVPAIPLTLRDKGRPPSWLAVRGEIFMSREGFTTLNKIRIERGEEAFANPRNAAAGMMRQLDPRNVAGDALDVFFYEILDMDGERPDSHQEVLGKLYQWGLKTAPINDAGTSLSDIKAYHQRLAEQRETLDYEIDGIVIEIDSYQLRNQLGVRARNPRWALAWKFAPREEVTTLQDIVVQVGRTGILTPVALLRPVDVGGVTVSRATLHNQDEVHRKDVRVGDKVRIIRAGDVIPEVKERVKQPGQRRGQRFAMPSHCPACGAQVVQEGAYSLCPAGLSCPAQLVGRIVHYASRNAMDIDHLGEKTAQQLVERKLVEDLADLYQLDRNTLEALEGFAQRSAKQLYEAIHKAKHARLDRFLYALGIRHVGERTARLLADSFKTLQALRGAGHDDLEAVPEIGEEIAASVTQFFAQKENQGILARLKKAGVQVEPMPESPRQRSLRGKTFVFTGELEDYTRDEAHERVERLGGRATGSVSGRTDYLVVGTDPGSKLDEARGHGVEVLDEHAFKQLIGDL